MSQDFTTRLQLQLREAALRDERRSAPRRWLAGVRYGMPAPGAAAAVAVAALLVVAVLAVGGLRWGEDDAVSNPKVIGSATLAENLGGISSGFGSVWVADSDRQVLLRVDPQTRRVQAEIRTGGDSNAQGGDPIVGVGSDAVWAIARAPGSDGGSRILRIDPATDRITSRATLPERQAPLIFDLQIVDGRPWVLTLRGAIEIDPATGRPGRFVALDPQADEDFPQWTIISGGELWVLTRAQRIDRYDLGTGRKGPSLPMRLDSPWAVLPTPDGLIYAGRDGELARADAGDGRISWRRQIGDTSTIPLVLDDRIWVHASDVDAGRDRLVEMDPRSGRVLSSTGLPEFGIAGMTQVGRDLWITTPAGKVMIVRP
jgi:outer membrane protein assembly factor BamB